MDPFRLLSFTLAFAIPASALSAQCVAESGPKRTILLDLYTSEGCDSCPPLDRWVSALPQRGYAHNVVVLAFHVDYWDRLGWVDPFGQRRFSERQRLANDRNGNRTLYTPQLMVNGKDYRRTRSEEDFGAHIADLRRAPASAAIKLALKTAPAQVTVTGAWSSQRRDAQAWLALYENRLASDVRGGKIAVSVCSTILSCETSPDRSPPTSDMYLLSTAAGNAAISALPLS